MAIFKRIKQHFHIENALREGVWRFIKSRDWNRTEGYVRLTVPVEVAGKVVNYGLFLQVNHYPREGTSEILMHREEGGKLGKYLGFYRLPIPIERSMHYTELVGIIGKRYLGGRLDLWINREHFKSATVVGAGCRRLQLTGVSGEQDTLYLPDEGAVVIDKTVLTIVWRDHGAENRLVLRPPSTT